MDQTLDTDGLRKAQRLERRLERRAARTKRSKWLSRLIFSLTGVGLMLLLRTHPEIVSNVVVYFSQANVADSQTAAPDRPSDATTSKMPTSTVPVRRGGNLPGNSAHAPQQDTQTQADAISAQLKRLKPGG